MTFSTGKTSHRYGLVKPDLLAPSHKLLSLDRDGLSCTTMSGTSVSAPVITGTLALLLSSIPQEQRKEVSNPAFMKQLLMRNADVIVSYSHKLLFYDMQSLVVFS